MILFVATESKSVATKDWGREGCGMIASGCRVSSCGDQILELNSGDGCVTLWIYEKQPKCTIEHGELKKKRKWYYCEQWMG